MSRFGLENKGGIPNIQINNRRAQIANGVGEIPLNRKGILSACNDGDEEIVEAHMKV